MPDTKITKARITTHWHYSSWKYTALVIIMILGWSLTYSITQYHPPRERKFEMYILSSSYSSEQMEALEADLSEKLVNATQETVAEEGQTLIEEVHLYPLSYGAEDDTYSSEVLMTRLAAGEGDIYFVDTQVYESFILQGLAVPLDEYLDSGVLKADAKYTDPALRNEIVGYDEDDNPILGEELHVYGISCEPLWGMLTDGIVDNRDHYMIIIAFSEKPELDCEVMNYLIERFEADKPEGVIRQEEAQREQIENLPTSLTSGSN